MSDVPRNVVDCFKEVSAALVGLKAAVSDAVSRETLGDDDVANLRKALEDQQATAKLAVIRADKLARELGGKEAEITDLRQQLRVYEGKVDRREEEILRLQDEMASMEMQLHFKTEERPLLALKASTSEAASPPRENRKQRPRQDSRSRSRSRREDRRAATRARSRSRSQSCSSRGSSSRSRSRRKGGGGSGVLTGSWTDRRGSGPDGPTDSALCIPFVAGRCKSGKDCRLRHPSDDDLIEAKAALRRKMCRFGSTCTRPDCIFMHDDRKAEKDSIRATACRYGTACKRPDCRFMHKDDDKPVYSGGGGGGGGNRGRPSPNPGKPPCRYGRECQRRDCVFGHT